MARLLLCFLLLIFTAPHSNAKLFPAGRDCLGEVLGYIEGKNVSSPEKIKLTAAAQYNEQIFKNLGEIPEEKLTPVLNDAIDNFGKYDGNIDANGFKSWLKENPGNIKSENSLGTHLNERYQSFKKIHPEVDLKKVAAEFPDELKKIALECGENIACNEGKVKSLFLKKFDKSCVGKFKEQALRSMVTGIALTNAGYFISYSKHPEKGYPFDLMANNLLWTPIITELGCRNTLANGEIGKKIDFGQISTKEKIKIGANNYVQYMKLSPLSNVSYVAFHTTKQLLEGEKNWKDVNMLDLSKQVGSMSIWDSVYPVPRMVLVTDPLFMKGFPQLRNYYYQKIPTAVAAEGSYILTDSSFRIGLSFLNTELMNTWVKKSDEWWNTGFAPKPAKEKVKKTGNSTNAI